MARAETRNTGSAITAVQFIAAALGSTLTGVSGTSRGTLAPRAGPNGGSYPSSTATKGLRACVLVAEPTRFHPSAAAVSEASAAAA